MADSASHHATVSAKKCGILWNFFLSRNSTNYFDSIDDPSLEGELKTLKWLAYEQWDAQP